MLLTRKKTFSSSLFDLVQNPIAATLTLTAGVGFAAKLLVAGEAFQATCLLMGLGYLFPLHLWNGYKACDKFCRKHGWSFALLLGLVIGSVLGGSLLFNADVAQAAFFTKTEQWMNSSMKMNGEMTKLIFNVLRLSFVIYLGIALVKVIQSARDGEDWQTLARTPAIVVVTVFLGDALAEMITGDGSSGASQ